MRRIYALMSLVLLTGCATAPGKLPETLVTPSYILSFRANCAEGEVGCEHLSGTLTAKGTTTAVRLLGSTYMVKCADGVTPCHIGRYDLSGAGYSVRAYPDGDLELTLPNGAHFAEKGDWLEY
jgi:hypothetical protein